MPFKGDLKAIGLYDVFQNIVHNQLSGALSIVARGGREHASAPASRWVAFEGGRVRFASYGAEHGLPMRAFVAQRGFVDAQAMAAAMQKKRRGRPALRTILADAGLLDEEGYRAALTLRVEEFLFELFGLRDASFQFDEGELPDRVFDRDTRGVPLSLDPMPLLMEAARRADEWERIRRIVGTGREFFVHVGTRPEEDWLASIWESLDGSRDVVALESLLPFGRFEIWDGVATLLQEGSLRAGRPEEILQCVEAVLGSGDGERACKLLERACEFERNDRELRVRLAELYELAHDARRAAEHFALAALTARGEDDAEAASELYERALKLTPDDLSLRESYVELIAKIGTPREYERESLALAKRFVDGGLGDRARQVLEKTLARPELALRAELLERYAFLMRDQGRGDAVKERLRAILADARRSGHEAGEREFLDLALRVFPDCESFRAQRDDLDTGARGVRRQRQRAWVRLGAATLVVAMLFVVCIEEMAFRRGVDSILHTLPQRIARGESVEVLADLQHVLAAHPYALSRASGTVLANSLEEAERIAIENTIQRDEFADARKRVKVLESLTEPSKHLRLASIRQRIERRAQVFKNLEPWMGGAGGSRRAFLFEREDARQVVQLYARLGANGRAGVRARLLELATPIGMPIFAAEALRGVRTQASPKGELSIESLLREYLSMPRDVDWQRARDDAYTRIVDAWLVGPEEQRARARALMPLFVDVPAEVPTTRAEFLQLSTPQR